MGESEHIAELLGSLRAQVCALTAQTDAQQSLIRTLSAALENLSAAKPAANLPTIAFGAIWKRYKATKADVPWFFRVEAIMHAAVKHFAAVPAAEVNRPAWTHFRDSVLKADNGRNKERPITAATRNLILARLKAVLNWAVEEDILPHNPLQKAKKERPRPPRETVVIEEDLQKLLAIAPAWLVAFVLVAIDSGMRRGEVLALRWSDVNDAGRVRVSWTVAKTKRSRSVRLSKRSIAALKDLPRHVSNTHVFTNHKTGDCYTKGYVSILFDQLAVEAGLAAADGDGKVRLHDLRHSFVTKVIQQGTPLPVALKASGHVTLGMAFRYLHLDESDLDEMVARQEKVIGMRKAHT